MVCVTLALVAFFTGFFLRGRLGHEILVEVERADPAASQAETVRAAEKTPAFDDGRLDLNVATQAELETLPGIGPVLSERILQYRETHDGFGAVSELLNVEGVGEKIYQKIVDDVKVG